jgi:hypothetical protein
MAPAVKKATSYQWGKKGQLAQFLGFLGKIMTNKAPSFIHIKK